MELGKVFKIFGKDELTACICHTGQISKIQNIISMVFEKWFVECSNQNEWQKLFNSFKNLYQPSIIEANRKETKRTRCQIKIGNKC